MSKRLLNSPHNIFQLQFPEKAEKSQAKFNTGMYHYSINVNDKQITCF